MAHQLLRAPAVFSLQLSWTSNWEEPAAIAAALRALDVGLELGQVYCGEAALGRTYRLRSAVGYCGAHYLAFVLVPELGGQ